MLKDRKMQELYLDSRTNYLRIISGILKWIDKVNYEGEIKRNNNS